VLFLKRFWPGIADGSITLTFRRWKRQQVLPGRDYRTPGGIITVTAVDVVDPDRITDEDAKASGHVDADILRKELRGTDDLPVYRIAFHLATGPDSRAQLAEDDELSDDDITAIANRLERLDKASKHGPWTHATLRKIQERPATRAGDLADDFGRERLEFKTDVRKLKNLGLTLSLDVGYELSPRGVAYLRATE
jgi:hypothetical protein